MGLGFLGILAAFFVILCIGGCWAAATRSR